MSWVGSPWQGAAISDIAGNVHAAGFRCRGRRLAMSLAMCWCRIPGGLVMSDVAGNVLGQVSVAGAAISDIASDIADIARDINKRSPDIA